MEAIDPNQFLGLPPCPLDEADAVLVPVPLEKTVSYGSGTWRAPRAILDASCQVEVFDEETGVDFSQAPRLHTLPLLLAEGDVEDYLKAIQRLAATLRGTFAVAIGGEHTLSYGMVSGLAGDPAGVTVVQVDAHADLADRLDGRRWSHGTVMRRLWERGCRLVQIGVRSLSREEHDLAASDPRIETYFAHQLPGRRNELLALLSGLRGSVYLTIDVDGFDPAVVPTTGAPQPDGLSWRQVIEILAAVFGPGERDLLGADVVELVASPHPPGCDLTVAKLVAKVLAFWWRGRGR